MKKKVLLTTVFTGYNYGSSLQAYAGKTFLKTIGYDCELVGMKSLVKGRDIRLKKLLTILLRSLFVSKSSKPLATFQKQYTKNLIGNSKEQFQLFTNTHLCPNYLTWRELKQMAKNCLTCFAGSDQIWNSTILYVDPLYYLRFAPEQKRIAFAPSLGRDYIADYNTKRMEKWISEIPHLSVREDSGVKVIKELTGRDAIQLIDPTLMLNAATWSKSLNLKALEKNYILAYFLDYPSQKAREAIKALSEKLNCDVIAIPYLFNDMSYCDTYQAAGPIEFLELVKNAKIVCTDSFHGTAFSINFHIPFYVFEREYGTAQVQSSRVLSILSKINMIERYEPISPTKNWNSIDFYYSESILNEERKKAETYVLSSVNSI